MLFIWFGTAHRAGWANQNLLLFNPLCLLLCRGGWRLLRAREPGRWFGRWLAIVVASAVAAWIMRWLPPFPEQDNTHWIALLLPIHAGLYLAFRRR
jgi:membrane protease YdiL (CAAX protease family)